MSRVRAAATAAAVAALAVLPAAGAHAVDVSWDGPTLSVAWDGTTRGSTETSFVGVPVAVPGDRAWRTVTVRNEGPTGGTLRAWVGEVDLLAAAPGLDDDFYDDLHLSWTTASRTGDASFRTLAEAGETLIAETHLAQGAATAIEVGYDLPVGTTSGNRSLAGEREASFVVRVQITGDTGPSAGADAGTAPADRRGASAAAGALARTGTELLRAGLLAVVAIALGGLLVGAARRRREVQNPGTSGSTPDAR